LLLNSSKNYFFGLLKAAQPQTGEVDNFTTTFRGSCSRFFTELFQKKTFFSGHGEEKK